VCETFFAGPFRRQGATLPPCARDTRVNRQGNFRRRSATGRSDTGLHRRSSRRGGLRALDVATDERAMDEGRVRAGLRRKRPRRAGVRRTWSWCARRAANAKPRVCAGPCGSATNPWPGAVASPRRVPACQGRLRGRTAVRLVDNASLQQDDEEPVAPPARRRDPDAPDDRARRWSVGSGTAAAFRAGKRGSTQCKQPMLTLRLYGAVCNGRTTKHFDR